MFSGHRNFGCLLLLDGEQLFQLLILQEFFQDRFQIASQRGTLTGVDGKALEAVLDAKLDLVS